mmetsp:Transcript_25267/g.35635  ORF Transcript_25267/g.35635 Transcript_25267/m.35635 type:complete len:961 (+) Transcript_25267:294-3176(+)
MPSGRNASSTISASALVVGSMVVYRFVSRKIKQQLYPREAQVSSSQSDDSDLESKETIYFSDDVGLAEGFSCFSEIDSTSGSLTTVEGEENTMLSSESTITIPSTTEGEPDEGLVVTTPVRSQTTNNDGENDLPVAPSTPPVVVAHRKRQGREKVKKRCSECPSNDSSSCSVNNAEYRHQEPLFSGVVEPSSSDETITISNEEKRIQALELENSNNFSAPFNDLDKNRVKSEIHVHTDVATTTTMDAPTPKQHNYSTTHKNSALLLEQDVLTLSEELRRNSVDEGERQQQKLQTIHRGTQKNVTLEVVDHLPKVADIGEMQNDDTNHMNCNLSTASEDNSDDDQSPPYHFISLFETDSSTNSKSTVISQTLIAALGLQESDEGEENNEAAAEIQTSKEEVEEEWRSSTGARVMATPSITSDSIEMTSEKIFIEKLQDDPCTTTMAKTINDQNKRINTSKTEPSLAKTVSQSSDETLFDSEFSTPTTPKFRLITLLDFQDKLEVVESYSTASERDNSSTKSCGGSDLESELSDLDSIFKSDNDGGMGSLYPSLHGDDDTMRKNSADLAESNGRSVRDRLPSNPQDDQSYVRAKTKFYEIINQLSFIEVDGDRVPRESLDWNLVATIWDDINDTHFVQHILQFRDEKQDANLLSWIVIAPDIPFDLFGRILFSFPDATKQSNRHGLTPLHCGVIHGASESIIQSLLWVYPDATKMKDLDGLTPLHLGMRYGASLDIIQALLRTNSDAAREKNEVGQTPFYVGLYAGASFYVLEALLQAYPGAVNDKCYDGSFPLHFEMMHGAEPDIIRLLLEAYPDAAKEKDKFGQTPLHVGVRYGASPEAIALLLDVYPDATKEKEKNGLTPLHCGMSKRRSSIEVIESLVQVYPEAAKEKDRYAQTPIHYGNRYGASEDAIELVRNACPKSPEEQMESMHAKITDMMGHKAMLEGAYESKDHISGELFPL